MIQLTFKGSMRKIRERFSIFLKNKFKKDKV